jgi:hypothetical protein
MSDDQQQPGQTHPLKLLPCGDNAFIKCTGPCHGFIHMRGKRDHCHRKAELPRIVRQYGSYVSWEMTADPINTCPFVDWDAQA